MIQYKSYCRKGRTNKSHVTQFITQWHI